MDRSLTWNANNPMILHLIRNGELIRFDPHGIGDLGMPGIGAYSALSTFNEWQFRFGWRRGTGNFRRNIPDIPLHRIAKFRTRFGLLA